MSGSVDNLRLFSCHPVVLKVIFLLICLSLAGFSRAEAVTDNAFGVRSAALRVEAFHAALLLSAQSDGDFAARAPAVAAAFDALFDVERIARISAGRAWRDLDDSTKAEFVALLRDVVIANYVSRFDDDRGQRFETLSTNEPKPQRFVVRTRINRPDKEAVPLDYYFRGALVFNVVADGVSDLSVRRADYAAIIEADGFDGLLAHLRAQLSVAQGLDGA